MSMFLKVKSQCKYRQNARKRRFAFWLQSIALMVVGFCTASCDRLSNMPKPDVVSTLPFSDASVHYWFDDDSLLLTVDNRAVVYDLDTAEIISDIAFEPEVTYEPSIDELPPADSEAEISEAEALAAIPKPTVTQLSDSPICLSETSAILTFASQQAGVPVGRGRYRINWEQPETYEEIDAYGPTAGDFDSANCMEENVFDSGVPAWFDGAQSQYLLYPTRQLFLSAGGDGYPSFSARPEDWSMTVRLRSTKTQVEDKTQIEESITLPAGPWVYRHGFWKTMSCFSCGCACYERITMQMENDQLYFMPYGKAVDDQHRGVYRLSQEGDAAEWEPIKVGGEVDSAFAVSPDGCRVAISEGGVPQIVDACES